MPFQSLQEILEAVKKLPPATLALASAAEANALNSVSQALRAGILQKAVLVGDQPEIERLGAQVGLDLSACLIRHQPDGAQAAKDAVALVRRGEAQILMKGLVHSADFLRALLPRQTGLRLPGRLLSHVYVLQSAPLGRLVLVTDSAFSIAPDVEAKAAIAANAALLARALGIRRPKVAAVAALEVVNPRMPATLDAAELDRLGREGAFQGFDVQGPLGLDNAVSPAAADLKGVRGEVAGRADILLMPDIEAGNILCKGFSFLGGGDLAGILMGAQAPVVMTSRADTDRAKLHSLALAHWMAEYRE